MDFYIIRADDKIQNNFTIVDFLEDFGEFEKPIVKYISKKGEVKFTDYIMQRMLFDSHHIFSDEIKEVIEIYSNKVKFKAIFLTDKDNSLQKLYWDTEMESLDCVLLEKVMKVDNISFYSDKINNNVIFFIKYEKQKHLVVREDLLESILRRYPIGLGFVKVKMIEGCK